MNSDHDEYNSSISVDSRACSSMAGAMGGEQAKVRFKLAFAFFSALDPISFAKSLFQAQLRHKKMSVGCYLVNGIYIVSRKRVTSSLCANEARNLSGTMMITRKRVFTLEIDHGSLTGLISYPAPHQSRYCRVHVRRASSALFGYLLFDYM